MPPRVQYRSCNLSLRPVARKQAPIAFRTSQQPFRQASNDPKLHPNPAASPTTDPAAPAPSSNPARTDSGTSEHGYGPGHASPDAQSNIDPKGPNMEQLPHVSEEAAAMSKSMGKEGPSVDQGTPVQDVLQGDKEAYDKLPKVMRDAMQQQKRSFSTFGRRRDDIHTQSTGTSDTDMPANMLSMLSSQDRNAYMAHLEEDGKIDAQMWEYDTETEVPSREEQQYPGQFHEITEEEAMKIATGELPNPLEESVEERLERIEEQGLKFPAPSVPPEKQKHLKRRYDGVIEQVTNLMMRDGKKGVAQRNVSEVLSYLRTAPSPTTPSQTRRLLALPAHTPTQSHLPLHPVFYLTYAIDSIAPLTRIRSQRGLAGGGVALQIPVPLTLRQRRRQAIVWILEACDKRKGGTSGFARRFAEEIVSIVEGKSSVWTKRENAHRLAIMGRSNLGLIKGGRR